MMYFFFIWTKATHWMGQNEATFIQNEYIHLPVFREKTEKLNVLNKRSISEFSWVFSKISVFAKRTGDFIFYMEFLKYQK